MVKRFSVVFGHLFLRTFHIMAHTVPNAMQLTICQSHGQIVPKIGNIVSKTDIQAHSERIECRGILLT